MRYPPALGGVERDVAELSRFLTGRGHDVEVWTSNVLTTVPFEKTELGSEDHGRLLVRRMRGYSPSVLAPLNEVLIPELTTRLFREAGRFGVVHAHGFRYYPTFGSVPARLVRRFPLVVSTHSSLDLGITASTYDALFGALGWRLVTRLICQTEREAEIFRRTGWNGPTHVIPPGVSPEFFRDPYEPGESPDSDACEDANFVLALGRIAPNKGFDRLILAAQPLLRADNSLRLVIAGEDHGSLPALQELAKRCGVSEQVSFPGRVTDEEARRLLFRARLFVFPSVVGEAWGITLMEAMAAGRAVVATRLPGPLAFVQDRRSGYLVDVDNVEQLRDRIGALLADPQLCESMGQVSRSIASGYSWEKTSRSIAEVLEAAAQEA